MNFTAELAIIDKYVEIKDVGDGEPLIVELITKHFLPGNRFEEARSWRNALKNKDLKRQMDTEIKEAVKKGITVSISRMPQNTDWFETSPNGEAKKTNDQQYHYDRTVSYLNETQEMLDDVDDVEICRNEWITFVARNSFAAGMREKGASMETLSMAVSDYIEMILLPDDFVEVEDAAPAQQLSTLSVEKAYESRSDVVSYLGTHFPQILKDGFLMNFYCQVGVAGKTEEVIVSNSFVAFLPEKRSGWGAGEMQAINRGSVSVISVGTEFHTEYQGVSSRSDTYWTLTFETTDYTQFTRWLYLGKNEKEMNQNRPELARVLDGLQNFFDLEQGESFESSSGYTTSYGVGWWV
jgi:hypothetical protein